MVSNEIKTENLNKSNVIYVSNNNAKYYEEAAAKYAENASKSVSDCANYVLSAQKLVTECEKIRDEAALEAADAVELHSNNIDNPHEVTAAQVDAYTKSEIDTIVSNVETGVYTKSEVDNLLEAVDVDLSSYYTSAQVNSKLDEKANINLEDTPFAESGLYITRTIDDTEWSCAYYSDSAKTDIVWLEQGGYKTYTSSIDADASVSVSITLPTQYKNGYYTRMVSVAASGFIASTGESSSSDSGTTLTVTLVNKNTSAAAPKGIWWQTAGAVEEIESSGGPDLGGNEDPMPSGR